MEDIVPALRRLATHLERPGLVVAMAYAELDAEAVRRLLITAADEIKRLRTHVNPD